MNKQSPVTFVAALFGALLLASSSALASDLPYTYGELRYIDGEFDDVDGDGFVIGGSYRINEQFYVVGGYTDLEFDVRRVDADGSSIEIGGGYIYPLNDTVDFNATFSLVRQEVEVGNFDDKETGFQITAGARTMLAENVEVRGGLNFIDVDDSDLTIVLGADYYFTEQISAGITFQLAGDTDVITIGGRYYFGR